MAEKPFMAGVHFIVRSMADVEYPISKSDLIKRVGNRKVRVDWNATKTMKELIAPIKLDEFECAASFYNALFAVM
jgi:hypothetical protein